MASRPLLWLACLTSLLKTSVGHPYYQTYIPNGDKIPHPCIDNHLWKGVGHKNPLGGADRNPFGLDFAASGHNWTTELCQKDSDGDGRTNGQETGDPDCKWKMGDLPSISTGLSHPGVCEPVDSDLCKDRDDWVTCETEEFQCLAVNSSDVKTWSLSLDWSHVPEEETTYMCQAFDVPHGGPYHMIAARPLINNTEITHHIQLFGCNTPQNLSRGAVKCNMGQAGCFNILAQWTVGLTGECFPSSVGVLIGTGGYQYVVMEVHWNNPRRRDDHWDASGLELYYTSKLRQQNAGMMSVGQMYLEIPPGVSSYTAVGEISSSCSTKLFSKELYIIMTLNHMHYLGRQQRVEVIRNGATVATLTNETDYSYDSPKMVVHDVPVLVRPGDVIRTTCVFSSISTKTTTYYGDSTSNEMCHAYLTFYPKEAYAVSFRSSSWKTLDSCKRYIGGSCNATQFLSSNDTASMIASVLQNCNTWGPCRTECEPLVRSARQHPCLQGEYADYVMNQLATDPSRGLPFLHAMQTCPDTTLSQSDDVLDDSAHSPSSKLLTVVIILMMCVWMSA